MLGLGVAIGVGLLVIAFVLSSLLWKVTIRYFTIDACIFLGLVPQMSVRAKPFSLDINYILL